MINREVNEADHSITEQVTDIVLQAKKNEGVRCNWGREQFLRVLYQGNRVPARSGSSASIV